MVGFFLKKQPKKHQTIKIILQADKPDSVHLLESNGPIIYLAPSSPTGSICLPFSTSLETNQANWLVYRSKPIEIYVTFQPTRFIYLISYLIKMCALTAQFHPYPAIRQGGIFSVTLSVFLPEFNISKEAHPLDGVAPYVVQTFLISPKANRDRVACNIKCKTTAFWF